MCDGYGTVRKPVSRYRTEIIIPVLFGSVTYFGIDQGETARVRVGERLVPHRLSVSGIGPSQNTNDLVVTRTPPSAVLLLWLCSISAPGGTSTTHHKEVQAGISVGFVPIQFHQVRGIPVSCCGRGGEVGAYIRACVLSNCVVVDLNGKRSLPVSS